MKFLWLLPTGLKEIPYARIRDINFKSAAHLKNKMDSKIDSSTVAEQSGSACFLNLVQTSSNARAPKANDGLTASKMDDLYEQLNCKNKPVILSVVPPYTKQFVSEAKCPSITELFISEYLIKLTLSTEQQALIENDTREQAKGQGFF